MLIKAWSTVTRVTAPDGAITGKASKCFCYLFCKCKRNIFRMSNSTQDIAQFKFLLYGFFLLSQQNCIRHPKIIWKSEIFVPAQRKKQWGRKRRGSPAQWIEPKMFLCPLGGTLPFLKKNHWKRGKLENYLMNDFISVLPKFLFPTHTAVFS